MVCPKFVARLKFAPLRYNDGSPCYFRAACLGVLALCLLTQGVLVVTNHTTEDQAASSKVQLSSASSLGSDVATALGRENVQPSQTVRATSVSASTIVTGAGSTPFAVAPNGVNGLGERNLSATRNVASTANVAAPSVYQPMDVSLAKDSSPWSFLGVISESDMAKQELLEQRHEAIAVLVDSAAYLNSCGTINSRFDKCTYTFKDDFKKHYEVDVFTTRDDYLVSFKAKGEQAQDPCTRFMVNSHGEYFAYDQNGYKNIKCFINSEASEKIAAVKQGLERLRQEENAALAARD